MSFPRLRKLPFLASFYLYSPNHVYKFSYRTFRGLSATSRRLSLRMIVIIWWISKPPVMMQRHRLMSSPLVSSSHSAKSKKLISRHMRALADYDIYSDAYIWMARRRYKLFVTLIRKKNRPTCKSPANEIVDDVNITSALQSMWYNLLECNLFQSYK